MNKLFDRIFWHNGTTPAINDSNLNSMSKAIDDIDDRVITLADDVMRVIPQIQQYLDQAEELVDALEELSQNPPYIGENGNWYVFNTATEQYEDSGIDASITVSIADVTALAPDAQPYVTNTGTDTDPIFHLFIPRGQTGAAGNGIASIAKTATSGLVDTYTITFTDGTTTTFTVTNGSGAEELDDLTDVDIDTQTLAANDTLVYDGTKWVNGAVQSGMATDGSNAADLVRFAGAFTVGSRSSDTVGINSVAEGFDIKASGNYSHAEGYQSKANGNNSHAEGYKTLTAYSYSHAEGYDTKAGNFYAHVEGYGVSALRKSSFVKGLENSTYKKFRGTTMSANGYSVFGFETSGEEWSSNTTVADSYHGCSGTILGNTTVTIKTALQGMYILVVSTYTISSGAIYGQCMKQIVSHGTTSGTPAILNIASNGTAATIAAASNNNITIKNASTTYATQFTLIRVL